MHTPGPWKAQVFHGGDGFGIYKEGVEHSIVNSNLYESTAYTGFFDAETTRSNAALIEAAPDLLNACELVDDAWTGNGDMATAIDALLLAIDKAKK